MLREIKKEQRREAETQSRKIGMNDEFLFK